MSVAADGLPRVRSCSAAEGSRCGHSPLSTDSIAYEISGGGPWHVGLTDVVLVGLLADLAESNLAVPRVKRPRKGDRVATEQRDHARQRAEDSLVSILRDEHGRPVTERVGVREVAVG